MKSDNPVLSRYTRPQSPGFAYQEGITAYGEASGEPHSTAAVTLNDVVVKTFVVLTITAASGVAAWHLSQELPWLLWVGLIGGLALGLINSFKKTPSPALVVAYSVLQGVLLGAISNVYSSVADGIVLQAVVATTATFAVMLTLYATGVIKATKKLRSILVTALLTYLVLGVANIIWAILGGGSGWGIYGTGFGPLVAVAGVLLAAFFLLMDFNAVTQGINAGAPERESWRMAFGLLMTIVWLYLEFLRLLSIVNRN